MSGGRIGAIVLAGGRSSRFGSDKLAELIDGLPMLDRAVGAVQAVASDVVVVVAPDAVRVVPVGARLIHDIDAFQGPLAGVAVGLAALEPDIERAIIVGGDMPFMVPPVLRVLIESLGDGVTGAILGGRGERDLLPMAVDRHAAGAAAAAILTTGERRLGLLRNSLQLRLLPEATWRVLDVAGATPRDIDTPSDLR